MATVAQRKSLKNLRTVPNSVRAIFRSALLLGSCLSLAAEQNAALLPSAEDVVEKVCATSPKFDQQIGYNFQKYSVSEELDKEGNAKERKEKRFDILWTNQVTTARLVSLNGIPQNTKSRIDDPHGKPSRGQRTTVDSFLKSDIIRRFQIEVIAREEINNRPTLVLIFKPNAKGLPVRSIEDRVINKLAGTVWIDEADYQVSKCDLHLVERTTMLGGIVAALDQFTLSLTRIRMAEGAWLNEHSFFEMSGRKLFDSFAVRVTEHADGFQRLDLGELTQMR